ncbi:MAG: hypothetical protein AABX52_03645 [Nanoarchaeota archaeon]
MNMIGIGQVCVKIAGRDAGKRCVVIDMINAQYALIDGETRRRKCNIIHLDPTLEHLDIEQNAPRDDLVELFKKKGWVVRDSKPDQKPARPVRVRKEKPKKEVTKEEKKG